MRHLLHILPSALTILDNLLAPPTFCCIDDSLLTNYIPKTDDNIQMDEVVQKKRIDDLTAGIQYQVISIVEVKAKRKGEGGTEQQSSQSRQDELV